MKDYLLLFRGGDAGRIDEQKNPEKWKAHMAKWKTWMENLGKEGKFISGLPLGKEGSVINGSKKNVTDGPFTEGKEIVGGYLMIKAADHSEAVELAKGCPLLDHEGTVEVRELQQLNM
ncbi:MAG: YciI family protein [Chitinophagaceae bacterium]